MYTLWTAPYKVYTDVGYMLWTTPCKMFTHVHVADCAVQSVHWCRPHVADCAVQSVHWCRPHVADSAVQSVHSRTCCGLRRAKCTLTYMLWTAPCKAYTRVHADIEAHGGAMISAGNAFCQNDAVCILKPQVSTILFECLFEYCINSNTQNHTLHMWNVWCESECACVRARARVCECVYVCVCVCARACACVPARALWFIPLRFWFTHNKHKLWVYTLVQTYLLFENIGPPARSVITLQNTIRYHLGIGISLQRPVTV